MAIRHQFYDPRNNPDGYDAVYHNRFNNANVESEDARLSLTHPSHRNNQWNRIQRSLGFDPSVRAANAQIRASNSSANLAYNQNWQNTANTMYGSSANYGTLSWQQQQAVTSAVGPMPTPTSLQSSSTQASFANFTNALVNRPLNGERGVSYDPRFANNPQAIRDRQKIKDDEIIATQRAKTIADQEAARQQYVLDSDDIKNGNSTRFDAAASQALASKKAQIAAHNADPKNKKNKIAGMASFEEDDFLEQHKLNAAHSEFKDKSQDADKLLKATIDGVNINREQLKAEQQIYKETVANNKEGDVEKEIKQAKKDGDYDKATFLQEELDNKRKADEAAKAKDAQENGKSDKSKKKDDYSNIAMQATRSYLLGDMVHDIIAISKSRTGDEAMAAGGGAVANAAGLVGTLVSSAPVVGQALKAMVDVAMAPLMRHREENERLAAATYRTQATTGRVMNINSLAEFGYSASDVATQMKSNARAQGNSFNTEYNAQNTLLLERGYGIDRSTIEGLQALRQSKTSDPLGQISGMVSRSQGTFFKDGDRTFLNEYIQKMTQLNGQLLQTNYSVDTNAMADQVNNFSRMSKVFDARDPRGMQNMAQVNNSLINSSNDYVQAHAFGVLRAAMPGASYTDIKLEQQKGIQSDVFLKSTISELSKIQDRDTRVAMYEQRFGVNTMVADQMDKGSTAFLEGKMGKGTYTDMMTQKDIQNQAGANTTFNERTAADIRDAFVRGGQEGMYAIGMHMVDAFKGAMAGSEIRVGNNGVLVSGAKAGTTHNRTAGKGSILEVAKYADKQLLNGKVMGSMEAVSNFFK